MRYLAIILLFVSAACQSKPTTEAQIQSSGKATADSSSSLVRIVVKIERSPRSETEIESGLLLPHKVQACLSAEPQVRSEGFSAKIQGVIAKKGELSKIQVVAKSEPLKNCLAREIALLKLNPGAGGAFQIAFVRSNAPEGSSVKPKGVVLDVSGVKKYE